jgi:hypothetical protein
MDAKKTRIYLFKAGRLIGPVSAQKVEELRKSKEIYQYSWMMDEDSQRWTPIDEMPKENPFQASMTTLKERVLSGAFLNRTSPVTGIVRGLHSFGVELFISGTKAPPLNERSTYLMNLIDETNLKSTNAQVTYQSQEKTTDGILLRFNWRDEPTPL